MLRVSYTTEQVRSAYYLWAALDSYDPRRDQAWDEYVDYRDGLPIGTTAQAANRFYTTAALTQRERRAIRNQAQEAREAAATEEAVA